MVCISVGFGIFRRYPSFFVFGFLQMCWGIGATLIVAMDLPLVGSGLLAQGPMADYYKVVVLCLLVVSISGSISGCMTFGSCCGYYGSPCSSVWDHFHGGVETGDCLLTKFLWLWILCRSDVQKSYPSWHSSLHSCPYYWIKRLNLFTWVLVSIKPGFEQQTPISSAEYDWGRIQTVYKHALTHGSCGWVWGWELGRNGSPHSQLPETQATLCLD